MSKDFKTDFFKKQTSFYIFTEMEINRIIMLSNNGVYGMFSFARD
jgi:hypothetical protein